MYKVGNKEYASPSERELELTRIFLDRVAEQFDSYEAVQPDEQIQVNGQWMPMEDLLRLIRLGKL